MIVRKPIPGEPYQYRHGDVYLREVLGTLPQRAKVIPPTNGYHVLALGESTGHYHAVPGETATLWQDEGGVTYLTVEQLTEVEHRGGVRPDHAVIPVTPAKTYQVMLPEEYAGPDRRQAMGD